ncbi:hypothetical protein B0J11DRAFT_500414 [Dendryphion nanum]|uniref:Conidiation-specific protein 10 n=1 Tax=Dendryphion nanum TaxID=256645 RepID=A0A9P9EIP7_9PLEO|nr:hypothetical protein B0J11DRAFT_500414 [Dendryphion nanum]
MADNNPANFANLPKDELREIAAKGGHASHGGQSTEESQPGRNPDGTFTKGSEVAKELGAQGGHAAHEHQLEKDGRNPDGTFKEGSKLAQELGTQGGHAAHKN